MGLVQGWCDCVSLTVTPCKIVRDLLAIDGEELKDWSWEQRESRLSESSMGLGLSSGLGPSSSLRLSPRQEAHRPRPLKNMSWECNEVELCKRMNRLSMNESSDRVGGGVAVALLVFKRGGSHLPNLKTQSQRNLQHIGGV